MRTHTIAGCVTLLCTMAFGAGGLAAQPKRGVQARLTFQGTLEDKVQAGKMVRPDGRADGKFRLVLQSQAPRKISHVLLRSCDARGVLTGRVAWDTDQRRLWVVGVFKMGRKLRTGFGRVIDRVRGRQVYNLYVSKPLGGFKPGTSYCAFVTFGDGMGVWARAAITEPVRAQLGYVGRDRDRVGTKDKGTPDGVPDAHFLVHLDSGRRNVTLKGFSLVQLDAKGRPKPGRRWDSTRKRRWILGVERRGRRLNRKHKSLTDTFRGKATYHLFAAPRGALKTGDRFRVVARFSEGSPARGVADLPDTKPATATLQFVGLSSDKIGARSPSGPDGKADGHFRLSLDVPTARRIRGLVLRAVWPSGGVVPNQIWDTRPRGYRMIAVYQGARRLNPKDRRLRRNVRGQVIYDLYVHNTGWVRPNQNFQVEVVFQGGDRIFAKTVVPATAAKPVQTMLTYFGFVADKVGTRGKGRGDGIRDAKFQLTVNPGGQLVTIKKFELSVSDAKGKTWRKTWDTRPGGNWILGVERGGKRLNARDRNVKESLSQTVTYTLWAANDFWIHPKTRQKHSYFTKGGYFTARIYLSTGKMVRSTIRIR